MAGTAVYILKPELVDPRFDGFTFRKGTRSILSPSDSAFSDFRVENSMYVSWMPRRLLARWKAQPVEGEVAPFNDYPCLELAIPAFSSRAVAALQPILSENGELLELEVKQNKYYAFNCLTKADALDLRKSRLKRSSPDKRSDDIEFFQFRIAEVRGLSIFRIPESPNIYLVTDTFKDRVEQAGLNGFNFIKVWPLPEDSDWHMEEALRRKKSKAVKLAGEALILRLRLKKEKPTASEKKNAKEIEVSLGSKLKVNSLDEKYRGSIEVTEFEDGELRVFCTCPDCDELAEYLADWFERVPWHNDFDIVKRYGNLYDKKAKETRMTIKRMS